MDEHPESSLDRFIQTRGTQMLGYSSYRYSTVIQIAVGGLFTAMGIGMLVGPLFGGDPGMAAGAMGPIIGGGVNLAIGIAMRRRYVNDQSVTVDLTPEAKGLLMALHRRLYGWRSPWVWSGNASLGGAETWPSSPFGQLRQYKRARRMARWTGVTPEMVPVNLDETELQHLDRVAAQYNRTVGALESGKAGSATLAKMAPRILKAADEAMAEALHQAAMLLKYPEGGSAARSRLEAQEKSLSELAVRVETMASGMPGITDKVAYRSSIDDVLDELRLEQLARSELKSDTPQEQQEQAS